MIMRKIINFILEIISNIKKKHNYRKKIKELKKRDPFIYKH